MFWDSFLLLFIFLFFRYFCNCFKLYQEGNQWRLWIVSKFSLTGLITTGIIYICLKFCLLTLCLQSFPREYLSLLASVVLSEICVLDKLLVILQTASFHHFAYIISNPSTWYFDKHLWVFFSLLFPSLFFFCSRKKLFRWFSKTKCLLAVSENILTTHHTDASRLLASPVSTGAPTEVNEGTVQPRDSCTHLRLLHPLPKFHK